MKLPVKLIFILVLMMLSLIGSSAYDEINHISEEAKTMDTFISLAAKEALAQQQDLYLQWNSTGSLTAALSETRRYSVISEEAQIEILQAIADGRISSNGVKDYTNKVRGLAIGAGLTRYNPKGGKPKVTDTDLYKYLDYLDSEASKANGNYNPIQFGLSYVDPELLKILFRDNLKSLIVMNYNDDINNAANSDRNRMEYREINGSAIYSETPSITISDIQLINVSDSSKSGTYSRLFGKIQPNSAGSELAYGTSDLQSDAMSNYVVSYTLRFTASAWHNTRTVIGKLVPEGLTESARFGIQSDSKFRWTTIDEGNGVISKYVSIPLPNQTYDTLYVLTN